jgi:hypothetical protein
LSNFPESCRDSLRNAAYLPVLANDKDPDGDPITAILIPAQTTAA